MKRTDLSFRFQKLLKHMPYVVLATTCADGTPWNTPLVGYFDDELNLYWSSWTASRHSQNVAHNPYVFAVVLDTSWPLGEGAALYLQMKARKLTRPQEIEAAKYIYLDRYGETDHEPFVGSCPRRIYKAEPLKVWTNFDGSRGAHFVDLRRQLLPKLASAK